MFTLFAILSPWYAQDLSRLINPVAPLSAWKIQGQQATLAVYGLGQFEWYVEWNTIFGIFRKRYVTQVS